MHVHEVIAALETIAPPELAEAWDNVGLLIGDKTAEVAKLALCIDLTGPVLEEILRKKVEMVMAYHPVIFKTVSRVTAVDTPVVYSAAKNNLAVYSMHTALDAAQGGTNDVLAGVIGLIDPQPLQATACEGRCKVVVFVPAEALSAVAEAAFSSGAGEIGNYDDCSFFAHGIGTYRPTNGASPTLGTVGEHEAVEEIRLEMIAPESRVKAIRSAIGDAHPYEEPAIDVYPLEKATSKCGLGRIGRLKRAVSAKTLVDRVKQASGCSKVQVAWASGSRGPSEKVSIAACCAGSCGSLAGSVPAGGATFYVTGEMRHHDALALAAEGVTCVCIGHSNSERMALRQLAGRLKKMLPGLSVIQSRRDVDPFRIV